MKNNLGWQIARTAHAWRDVLDKRMAELGLTQSKWIAMQHLRKMGEGCSQKELAANIGIEQPSLQRTLNSLVEAGLIIRNSSDDDARRKTLWFSEAGRNLVSQMELIATPVRAKLLEGVSDEEQEFLHELLLKIQSNAKHILDTETK